MSLLAVIDPLGEVRAPWLIEVVGPLVAVTVAVCLAVQTVRNRKLSVPALLFIGTTTMFWQEFYADWGAFLYYNSAFTELPWWGESAYTTPNKPLFVIFGYGWFFAGSFPGLLLVIDRLREARPSWPRWVSVAFVAGPLFFLWNLVTADGAAYLGHWWNYAVAYGPALHTTQGQLAFLFPAIPFAVYASLTLGLVSSVDDRGQRPFERLARLAPFGHGWRHEAHRALVWAITMNLCYGLFFTLPIVLIRVVFLGDSQIVP